MGRVTVLWGDAGLTCMRNGDYHGAIIEADLALPIACALPPPLSFMVGCVLYVFNAPFQNLQQSKNQKSLSRRKKNLNHALWQPKKNKKNKKKRESTFADLSPLGKGFVLTPNPPPPPQLRACEKVFVRTYRHMHTGN